MFGQIPNNPQTFAKDFNYFAKVAQFRHILSHCNAHLIVRSPQSHPDDPGSSTQMSFNFKCDQMARLFFNIWPFIGI